MAKEERFQILPGQLFHNGTFQTENGEKRLIWASSGGKFDPPGEAEIGSAGTQPIEE